MSQAGRPGTDPAVPLLSGPPPDAPGTAAGRAGFARLPSDAVRTPPGNPATAGAVIAGFGAELLRAVRGTDPNSVISPYSIYAVLAMARCGANGQTATQLDALLGPGGPDGQGAAVSAIDSGVELARAAAERAGEPIVVRAANEIWLQDGLSVRQEYLDQLARQFGVSAVGADFRADPESIRAAINDWVAGRTNQLIPELFPAGTIGVDTVLVLVNALYLKASWLSPFFPLDPGPFHTSDGATVQVPMMHSMTQLPGAAGQGWTAVTVPYRGSGLRMTLLVPDLGGFDALLARLDAELMAAASTPTTRFQLDMPPFKITSIPDVQTAVQSLGVIDLFGAAADLSGIAGAPGDLRASAFVHQATITVDRYGTEAAAATGMSIATRAMMVPPARLIIDRPFLFWISETTSGAPLFLGTVTNPGE